MKDAVNICKLNEEKVGVPFLFASGKCYIGAPDVISFFTQEAGI